MGREPPRLLRRPGLHRRRSPRQVYQKKTTSLFSRYIFVYVFVIVIVRSSRTAIARARSCDLLVNTAILHTQTFSLHYFCLFVCFFFILTFYKRATFFATLRLVMERYVNKQLSFIVFLFLFVFYSHFERSFCFCLFVYFKVTF